MKDLVGYICSRYNLNYEDVVRDLQVGLPDFFNEKECSNCGGSMKIYTYTLDCLDALLVYGMGKIVRKKLGQGMTLNEANRIHLQSALNTYYSVPSRSTQCSKLGLIAKVLNKNGSHDQKAGWCITTRGFQFLANKEVPKFITVFQNKIVDHHTEVTTIGQAFQEHKDLLAKRKPDSKRKSDYSSEVNTYNPSEWFDVAGFTSQW